MLVKVAKVAKASAYQGLGEGPSQGEEQRVEPPATVDGRVHHVARVHSVAGDATRGQAAVQLVGEENVAEFGAVVGQHGPVVVSGW